MFTDTFVAVLVASFLACAVTTAGIWAIGRYAEWASHNAVYFMSFAAGVLIGVSFTHITPESFEINEAAPIYLLAGFLGLLLLNRFLTVFVCSSKNCRDYTLGLVPALGIGLHSLIDGVIYAVTFNVSILTGALAAIGMVFHEFPEGIVTFVLLERSGIGRRKTAIYAFLAAAISTPIGTLIAFPFISRISRPALGSLLAISAGALEYVGARTCCRRSKRRTGALPCWRWRRELVSQLGTLWQAATPEEQRDLTRLMVKSVYVDVVEQRITAIEPAPQFSFLLREVCEGLGVEVL